MFETADSVRAGAAVSVAGSLDLRRVVRRWLDDGRAQGHSPHTTRAREQEMARFCWWLETVAKVTPRLENLDAATIREFLSYLRAPGQRWASERAGAARPMKPRSVIAYYRHLRTFCNWCMAEGLLAETFMRNVKPPRVPQDQVQPLSPEQVRALVAGCHASATPDRDRAIVIVLYDTGLRVSELCSLTLGDVDRGDGALMVTGKGGKRRAVIMGRSARQALWRYTERERGRDVADEPLFVSNAGPTRGEALTPRGVHYAIAAAGRAGGVTGVRMSPHTLRHSFAVAFLRNGGGTLQLKALLGHASLKMVANYVNLAEADVERAHRAASPADRLRLR